MPKFRKRILGPAALTVGTALATMMISTGEARASDIGLKASDVQVSVVSVFGSGCRNPEDTKVVMSEDLEDVTILYTDYAVYTPSPIQENCVIILNVNYPEWATFALTKATYHGTGHLETGVTGSLWSSHWFQGSSQTSSERYDLRQYDTSSGYDESGDIQWTVPDKHVNPVYMACDGKQRYLNIDSRLVLGGQTTGSVVSWASMTSTDVKAKARSGMVFHFDWRRCAQ